MDKESIDCIKTRRFLFWEWEYISHNYKMHSVTKFMECSDTFHVYYECNACGATKVEKFIEKDTLILAGIPVEDIEEISSRNMYKCKTV